MGADGGTLTEEDHVLATGLEIPVIENNKPMGDEKSQDELNIVRAQKRLLGLHRRFRKTGGWRAVAIWIGVLNVSYVHAFVKHGELAANLEIRERLLRGRRPEEVNAMDERMQRLYDLMKYQHVGKQRGIKKRDLLRALYGDQAAENESYNNPDDRELREMITGLNHDHGALICSTPADGYFWAGTLNEGLRAVDRLKKRAVTQLGNVSKLESNLKRSFGGQMELEVGHD